MFLTKSRIDQIANGSDELMEEMFNMYSNMVYLYIVKMVKDDMLADELLIDTFAYVFKNIHKYTQKSKETTWICGIAKNFALHALRDERRKNEVIVSNDELVYQTEETKEKEIDLNIWESFQKQLNLTKFEVEVCVLFFCNDMKQKDIAILLNSTLNIVKKTVAKGKERIRKFYKNEGSINA